MVVNSGGHVLFGAAREASENWREDGGICKIN